MKKMRKFISLAVVFTMLCSLLLPAFSYANDIEGTKYEEATAKLAALKAISGYTDGTFKPENTITRAELAVVITSVLGLQDAVELAKATPTRFSDVKTNEWYTGAINIAANENVISGYPDGTFKPSQNVSYSEAVTMLVNALGLKQVVDKSGGVWPSNYMSKASQLGITKVLSNADGSAKAIRGDVFMMAWETLLQNQWGATGFNDQGEITYGNLGKTLLASKYPDYVYDNNGKMEAKYFEEILVTNTPATKDTLKANQIEIELEDIAEMLNITSTTASDTKPYKISNDKVVIILPENIDSSSLLGKELTLFFGEDNEVAYIGATSDALSRGELDSVDATNSKIKVDGTKYTLTSDADLYINNIEINEDISASSAIDDDDIATKLALLDEIIAPLDGTVKVDMLMNSSNKVTSLQVNIAGTFTIETENASDSDYEFEQFVVKSIRSDSTLVDLNGTRKFKTEDMDDEDSDVIVMINGKIAKAEDIEVGNVVMTAKNTNGDIRLITVTDETVTGTLDRISSSYGLKINGVTYEQGGNAMLSTEDDMDETEAMSSDISTLIDSEVTLHLDSNGNYVLAMGESEVTLARQYGIVAKTPVASDIMYDDDDEPYLRLQIIDQNGNKVGYKVMGDSEDQFKQVAGADINSVAPGSGNDWTDKIITDFTKGTFVSFSTDSTGKSIQIENLTKLENTTTPASGTEMDSITALSKLTIPDTDTAVKDSTKSFKDSTGKTFYITDETVILNQNAGKLELVDGWSTLVSNTDESENMLRNTTPLAVFNANTRIVKYLIINDDGTNYQATQDKYGIIMDIAVGKNDKDNKVWQVTVFTDGEESTYEVADVQTDISTVLYGEEGDLVRYDINNDKFVQTGSSDIKIDMSAFLDDSEYDGFIDDDISDRDQLIVDEVLGNLIVFKKVDGEAIDPISVSDDVIVYDLSDSENPEMSSIKDIEGRMIMFLNTEGDTSEYEMIIILD